MVVDGSSYTNDDELLPDEFAATDKFTAVGAWVRRQTRDLPLWWAEYYVEPADGDDERDGWSEAHRRAVHAAGLIAMVRGGAGSGLLEPAGADGPLPGLSVVPDGTPAAGAGHCPCTACCPGSPGRSRRAAGTRPCPSPRTMCPVRVLATSRTVLVVNTLDRPISARGSTASGSRWAPTRCGGLDR